MNNNPGSDLEKSEGDRNTTADTSFLEYLAKAEALIDKGPMRIPGNLGERMIHLTSGTVLFALVLAEVNDSFIVSYPSVLTNDNGRVTGRLMMDVTQARLFKSCIVTTSEPSELHKYYYLRFLLEDLDEIPAIFTGKRLESVLEFLSTHKDKNTQNQSNDLEEDSKEDSKEYGEIPLSRVTPYRKKTRH
jgi:hypothetical protein